MPRKPADLTPKRKNKHFFFVFLNGPRDPPKTSEFLEKPAENSVLFDKLSRKIEFLRGISRKSRDFGREKTKHDTKSAALSGRVLFFPCQQSRFFEKFRVRTRFSETTCQKNMLLEIDLFYFGHSQVKWDLWLLGVFLNARNLDTESDQIFFPEVGSIIWAPVIQRAVSGKSATLNFCFVINWWLHNYFCFAAFVHWLARYLQHLIACEEKNINWIPKFIMLIIHVKSAYQF